MHGFYSSATPSGENAVVQMQLDALVAAGHDVKLFPIYTDELVDDGFYRLRTAFHVSMGRGYDPSEDLRAFAPDIVHIHNLFPNFSTRWLENWAGPVAATLHNFRPLCASGNLFRDDAPCTLCPTSGQIHGVINRCYKGSTLATIPLAIKNRGGLSADPLIQRADRIVFLSERAQTMYRYYGLNDSKSSIIPNFVRPFATLGEDIADEGPWVYAGRLSRDKGITSLVQAWPSTVRLDVYGDGPEMGRLRELDRPSVVLHGGVSREDVLQAVARAEGIVIPSLWAEGMPTIYIEALAAGVPVLAKAGNSAADDVRVSGAGRVFREWSEVPELIKNIQRDRPSMGRAATKRFVENFTEETWLSRIEELYAGIVPANL